MKTVVILIVMIAAIVQSSMAQVKEINNEEYDSEELNNEEFNSKEKPHYGFSISQFKTGSGFRQGAEAHFTIQSNTKSKLGFGIFIDGESKKFSGLTLTHQRLLMANRAKLSVVQPYIFYNFIYRKTTIPEVAANNADSYLDFATYTSMEHHFGMGLNINILKNIILSGAIGYGIYLGSIKRPSAPDPITREISGTNGTGFLLRTGIEFQF